MRVLSDNEDASAGQFRLHWWGEREGAAVWRVERSTSLPRAELIEEYVISTPEGRAIVRSPEEVFGASYQEHLRGMMRRMFLGEEGTRKIMEEAHGSRTTLIDVLTGAADYDGERVLPEINPALNSRSVLKVLSKRELEDGAWITNAGPIKGNLAVGSPLLLISPDIVATGASSERIFATALVLSLDERTYGAINARCGFLKEGESAEMTFIDGIIGSNAPASIESHLGNIRRVLREKGEGYVHPVQDFVFVVNGTDIAGEVAAKYAPLYQGLHPGFRGFRILYSEGIFKVARKDTPLAVKVPGTDILVQRGSALELITEMLNDPSSFLNTCVVYYGSSRARDIRAHIVEVLEPAIALYAAAQKGLSKEVHLRQRMPPLVAESGKSREQFQEEARDFFSADNGSELTSRIDRCYQAYIGFWESSFASESLAASLHSRIGKIMDLFDGFFPGYVVSQLAEKYGVKVSDLLGEGFSVDVPPESQHQYDKLLAKVMEKRSLVDDRFIRQSF